MSSGSREGSLLEMAHIYTTDPSGPMIRHRESDSISGRALDSDLCLLPSVLLAFPTYCIISIMIKIDSRKSRVFPWVPGDLWTLSRESSDRAQSTTIFRKTSDGVRN